MLRVWWPTILILFVPLDLSDTLLWRGEQLPSMSERRSRREVGESTILPHQNSSSGCDLDAQIKLKYCCSWLHLLHVFLRVALLTCAFLTHEFYSIIFSSVSLQDQILCNRETAGGAGTPDRKAQGGCSNSCWGRLMQQKLKSYTLDWQKKSLCEHTRAIIYHYH